MFAILLSAAVGMSVDRAVGFLARPEEGDVSAAQFLGGGSAPAPRRLTHRKTLDGRLCSAEYTQGGVTYSDCTMATNPDGVAGREWSRRAAPPGLSRFALPQR